jgi:nucleoside-diphosphate-sugar epimerase
LELLAAGQRVRGVDVLLHSGTGVTSFLREAGVELMIGDLRDSAIRSEALEDVEAVVHLAAIVGDPACARQPLISQEVNVKTTSALAADAERAGAERFIFASTCSNYGRTGQPEVPIDEDARLAPVSLYAEQKVEVEQRLLSQFDGGLHVTCLRFATLYGVAPRMRFDLTVNEFTRDLWADRVLDVFGERFWRPYVHVRDAARAVRLVLESPLRRVDRAVFNVGHSDENYRKVDIVEEIRRQIHTGTVRYVSRPEDPRDYRVSFERIHAVLGFSPRTRVPDGIAETVSALSEGRFGDPFDPIYSNLPMSPGR